MTGALALPDGRLLSWSDDNTLRLWDGASGAALATLEGHTWPVTGALALPDGRLLSWSNDNTLRLWDGASGALLLTIEQNNAKETHPELHRAYRRAIDPDSLRSATAPSGGGGGPALRLNRPAAVIIPWNADGYWFAAHLRPDGTLVAHRDKHVAILHLHHGNSRVSVEQAEALLTPEVG